MNSTLSSTNVSCSLIGSKNVLTVNTPQYHLFSLWHSIIGLFRLQNRHSPWMVCQSTSNPHTVWVLRPVLDLVLRRQRTNTEGDKVQFYLGDNKSLRKQIIRHNLIQLLCRLPSSWSPSGLAGVSYWVPGDDRSHRGRQWSCGGWLLLKSYPSTALLRYYILLQCQEESRKKTRAIFTTNQWTQNTHRRRLSSSVQQRKTESSSAVFVV